MRRSRPASYNVSNKGLAITNGLDVDGVKLLSVSKCHSIFFVGTYYPDVGTIDDHTWITPGADHTWKVHNIIKLSLCISQVFCALCFAIALETLSTAVHAANALTPNKSPITL